MARCEASYVTYGIDIPCALEAGHAPVSPDARHVGRRFDNPDRPLQPFRAGFRTCTGKFTPWAGDLATSAPPTEGPTPAR